jgi:hypothetical protein
MYFHGCASHGLHLMIKDIFAVTKAKRGRPIADYPEEYPFEYLQNFVQDCKDVVSFFSFHHQEKAKLVKLQAAENKCQLVQPAPTRWGSLINCMKQLKESESILHQIVSARDFCTGSQKQKQSKMQLAATICSEDFLTNLDKCIDIMEPINVGITAFQSDQTELSLVYQHFAVFMKEAYENMAGLSIAERKYLLKLVDERLEFMYGDAIGVAYLLDPVLIGKDMLSEHKKKAEDALFDSVFQGVVITHENHGEYKKKKDKLFLEYTKWVISATSERAKNEYRYQMLENRAKTCIQYWLVDGASYPTLRDVAINVFSMVTSSAASERGFSAMGFVHSKLRNRLSTEKVEKLVFIKNNAPQLTEQASIDWGSSDIESEDEEGNAEEDKDSSTTEIDE